MEYTTYDAIALRHRGYQPLARAVDLLTGKTVLLVSYPFPSDTGKALLVNARTAINDPMSMVTFDTCMLQPIIAGV
jgi:hypothetical protein